MAKGTTPTVPTGTSSATATRLMIAEKLLDFMLHVAVLFATLAVTYLFRLHDSLLELATKQAGNVVRTMFPVNPALSNIDKFVGQSTQFRHLDDQVKQSTVIMTVGFGTGAVIALALCLAAAVKLPWKHLVITNLAVGALLVLVEFAFLAWAGKSYLAVLPSDAYDYIRTALVKARSP
jgi:hypothetical protein